MERIDQVCLCGDCFYCKKYAEQQSRMKKDNAMNFDDCKITLNLDQIGKKKTRLQSLINYIKNFFRKKEDKKHSIKFYVDDEYYIEQFATTTDIKLGKVRNGLCSISFSGTFEK